MKINVAQLLKEPVGSVRHYQIDEIDETGCHIYGEVQLLRTNRSILVNGKLATTSREVCSRCLEDYNCPLELDIEEEYYMTREMASGLPLTPPAEPGVFTVDENNIIDLSEAIRQYTLLAQPMKPVCLDDCAGLCPQCGRNLNYETCSCAPVGTESPWAPLQELLLSKKLGKDKER